MCKLDRHRVLCCLEISANVEAGGRQYATVVTLEIDAVVVAVDVGVSVLAEG